jgi:cobalt-zinc-cadmium resistance protein CzcA
MFDWLINQSMRNKMAVAAGIVALVVWGLYSAVQLPFDAVPDITNNQIQVITHSPALAPQEVERYLTIPVEQSMANLPGLENIRSLSRFGLSVVTLIFDEDVPHLQARQLVTEQLNSLQQEGGTWHGKPTMMPMTTGLGEIYQYTLEAEPGFEHVFDARRLRSLQDWLVKRRLAGMEGVVEVSSFGGGVKQHVVALDDAALRSLNLSVGEVWEAVVRNHGNAGGSYLERGSEAMYIRAEGLAKEAHELEQSVVAYRDQRPVLLGQVARIVDGQAVRFGAMTRDGRGEAVGGIVLMLKGSNAYQTLETVHKRIEEVQTMLPKGVRIVPYLDRSDLLGRVLRTVRNNLLEGGLIVVFVLVLLMGSLRAGLVVASVIPLSLLFALGMMRALGISANLMSLGAIDFGLVVDGAVIIVERIVHVFQKNGSGGVLPSAKADQLALGAARSIRKSAAFGEIIIMSVYLPILALGGVEGKMFQPMAITVGMALFGALLLSLTYVPVMASMALSSKSSDRTAKWSDFLMSQAAHLYRPALLRALRNPKFTLSLSIVALLLGAWLFSRLGSVFVPTLEEGDLAMQMTVRPGSNLGESIRASTAAERILLTHFPEVRSVVSKIGTAEIPTDPMAIEDSDVMILLKPREEWTTANNREELVERMKEKLEEIPGVGFEFTQPIQLRFNELLTGVKSDVAVRIYGPELGELASLGEQAAELCRSVPGAGDVLVQATEGLPQLMVRWDRTQLAWHGLDVATVNRELELAFAGGSAGVVFEGDARHEVVVRLNDSIRHQPDRVSALMVKNAAGQLIPLGTVGSVSLEQGPSLVSRDNTQRYLNVLINVRGRDMEGLVKDIRQKIDKQLKLPPGYAVRYEGQYKQLNDARQRLSWAVPVTLLLITLLLRVSMRTWRHAFMILTAVPLSALGGILALYARDLPFSISAAIGFIALFGVAVLNGLVLVGHLNQIRAEEQGDLGDMNDLTGLVAEGCVDRLRPVLMTALVAALGFMPMALSTSAGAEVQQPLATVVVGGLITSTLLTLLVLPALYLLFERKKSSAGTTGASLLSGGPSLLIVLFFLIPSGVLLLPTTTNAQLPTKRVIEQTRQTDYVFWRQQRDQWVELVVRNHPRLQEANLAIREAEARMAQVWFPGKTQINYDRGQINYALIDRNISIVQPLGSPLSIGSGMKYGRLEVQLAKARREEIRLQLIHELRDAYSAVAYFGERLRLLDKHAQVWRQADSVMQIRTELGIADRLSALLSRQQLDALNWQLPRAQLEREQASRILSKLCALDTLPSIPDWPIGEVSKPGSARPHPMIMVWDAQRALDQQAENLQRATFGPEISLGAFSQSLEQVGGFRGVMIQMSLPLVPLKAGSSVEAVRLMRMQNHLRMNREALHLGHEVAQARQEYVIYAERVRKQISEVDPRLNELLDQANFMLVQGRMTYYEYAQTLESIHQSRLDNLYNEYQLHRFAHRLAALTFAD